MHQFSLLFDLNSLAALQRRHNYHIFVLRSQFLMRALTQMHVAMTEHIAQFKCITSWTACRLFFSLCIWFTYAVFAYVMRCDFNDKYFTWAASDEIDNIHVDSILICCDRVANIAAITAMWTTYPIFRLDCLLRVRHDAGVCCYKIWIKNGRAWVIYCWPLRDRNARTRQWVSQSCAC